MSDSITVTITFDGQNVYATHSARHSAHQRSKVPPVNFTVRPTESFGVNEPSGLFTPNDSVTVTVMLTGGTFDLFDGYRDGVVRCEQTFKVTLTGPDNIHCFCYLIKQEHI